MSDSFLGRWSNRKLQKKATVQADEPQTETSPIPERSVVSDLKDASADTVQLETPVIQAIPESAAPSDNPIAEVASESNIDSHSESFIETSNEPAPSRTGEMDTSSALDAANSDKEPEPLLSDADMPEIQTLDASSDISAFFNRGVSKTLRNAALKHIFGLSAYNVRDGLNDYDEDYTVFEPLGDTVTCDMKFHKERKEKLEAERLEQERLEQERLLAEAESESKTNKETEEQEQPEDAVASNESNDDATLEQDNDEQVLASSSDEPLQELESSAESADADTQVAQGTNQELDSILESQDESEHV